MLMFTEAYFIIFEEYKENPKNSEVSADTTIKSRRDSRYLTSLGISILECRLDDERIKYYV